MQKDKEIVELRGAVKSLQHDVSQMMSASVFQHLLGKMNGPVSGVVVSNGCLFCCSLGGELVGLSSVASVPAQPQVLVMLPNTSTPVNRLYEHNGRLFASHSDAIREWAIGPSGFVERISIRVGGIARSLLVKGDRMFTGGDLGELRILDMVNHVELTVIRNLHQGAITDLAILTDPQGRILSLISSGYDGKIKFWNDGIQLIHETQAHRSSITKLALVNLPQGKILLSSSTDGYIKCWDALTPSRPPLAEIQCFAEVCSLSVVESNEGILPLRLVSSHDDGTARCWDLHPLITNTTTSSSIQNVQNIQIISGVRSVCRRTLLAHQGRAAAVAAVDQNIFITGGAEDSSIKLWNISAARV
eukprot:TRINITY_DN8861_c0_g1_i1.p1 TRINITY_DN8861_c0_g1~~TRINITY_DN8861_c0_g1_i1.p1  ORF type:complete len:360 (-),score=74.92 TRINITY_DN8861_c0_g1_i1:19-1098(-)